MDIVDIAEISTPIVDNGNIKHVVDVPTKPKKKKSTKKVKK